MPRKVTEELNTAYNDEFFEQGGQRILAFFRYNIVGKVLSVILITCLVCVVDVIIASDKIELFYTILGIELLLLILGIWLMFLWRNR